MCCRVMLWNEWMNEFIDLIFQEMAYLVSMLIGIVLEFVSYTPFCDIHENIGPILLKAKPLTIFS